MKKRIYLFYLSLIFGVGGLLARSGELQLVRGYYYQQLAEGNRIKKEIIPAPRGIIYDRKGQPLVRNIPIYRKKIENCQAEKEGIKGCFLFLKRDEALRLESQGEKDLRVDIGREYLGGETLAHLLGYLGEANFEEINQGKYKLGDLVGRGGIEEQYDSWLRGEEGVKIFETNAEGEKIRLLGVKLPKAGNDLYLTIDKEISQTAFSALEGKPGAVVVSKVETGEILALVSSPSFDPNLFNQLIYQSGEIQEKIRKILTNPQKPLFNRAIAGVYPPGSTFKIVSAVAGLEEGKITKDTLYEDTGEIRVGDYVYRNWYFTQYGKTEGMVNVVKALKRSTDTFFYKLGEWVGASRLKEWAESFGLGKLTGIDLPGEAKGKVPDPTKNWFLGNTYHFAIGQGDLMVTPLQVNLMTSVIANNGKLCSPKLTKLDRWQKMSMKEECQDLKLKSETLEIVKEGMKEACLSGGTAFPLFDFSPPVACKTGTAEFNDPAGRTHAWLTAFWPAEEPKVVVTVVVEAGGEGSRVAGPIVKKVLEKIKEVL
ncbi:MAG: penicillin-binding transpeptidase domain-containing protein [Microgenomates group bacterium]